MVKLIQNIPTGNDGEQHKDNNNNAIKYLESNKDNILDLAEKNFENILEALTNNVIETAGASSSNATLSLTSSSSIFSNPFSQSDTYRIEVSEGFQYNKGDITVDRIKQ
jgi:hypothetical protein